MADEPVVEAPAAAATPAVEPAAAPVEPAAEPTAAIEVPTPGIGNVATPPGAEIPEAYRTADGTADITKLLERANAADAADAKRPAATGDVLTDAAGFKLDLNEDIKLFNGASVEFRADDPLMKEGQELVHGMGLGQEDFSKLLTFAAKMSAQNMNESVTVTQDAVNAEIAKLGSTEAEQTARVDALGASLSIALGGDDAAFALLNELRTVSGFMAMEKLMDQKNGMGGERSPMSNGMIRQQKPLANRLFGT